MSLIVRFAAPESDPSPDADITRLLTLCNLRSKSEVETHCRSLTLRQCDFGIFIEYAQCGVFDHYRYVSAFRDRQPPHLIPTAEERAAIGAAVSGGRGQEKAEVIAKAITGSLIRCSNVGRNASGTAVTGTIE
jgi:hypothetical protein